MQELQDCTDELAIAGRPGPRDPFAFTITRRTVLTGPAAGLQLTVAATLAGRTFEEFPIDLTVRLRFVGPIETVLKPLPVTIDDVQPPQPMRLYPLADQVADKVAAMYELHAGQPSGRYRDLVDLVLILTTTNLNTDIDRDMDLIGVALRLQQTQRNLVLPARLTSPGPAWPGGYANAARSAGLAPQLCDLPQALATVGGVLDPVLLRLHADHTGDP
jgi:hypothetical protein